MKVKMKLHSMNFGGNLHESSNAINRLDMAEYVIAMQSSGMSTVVVFRMPAEMVYILREGSGYSSDPHHDDPS